MISHLKKSLCCVILSDDIAIQLAYESIDDSANRKQVRDDQQCCKKHIHMSIVLSIDM